jgi:hypothetical protein
MPCCCSSTQDHFAAGAGVDHLAAHPHLHAAAAQAGVGLGLQLQLDHLRRGPELEIGPIHAGGTQKSFRRAPAPALFLIDLKVTDTLIRPSVEVVGRRHAGLLRGLGKGVQNVPAQALFFDPPLAVCAMEVFKILKTFWPLAPVHRM